MIITEFNRHLCNEENFCGPETVTRTARAAVKKDSFPEASEVKKCGALSCGFERSYFENWTEVQFDPPTSVSTFWVVCPFTYRFSNRRPGGATAVPDV
mgnify:FL=1